MTAAQTGRSSVSVIVPFAGSDDELRRVIARLHRLATRPGDELIVADNRPGAASRRAGEVEVIAAAGVATPGYARNRGAAAASGEWLVFIDADTEPAPSLLEAYFASPPGRQTALLAGSIRDAAGAPTPVARYAVVRAHMNQDAVLCRPERPYALSANCAVRRAAFAAAAGFDEHARAGEDADLWFRLQDRGWVLERRPDALVEHLSRPTVGALLAQLARHGSGAAWCNRRHPGSFPPPTPRVLVGRLRAASAAAAAGLARGEREQAAFALLDLFGGCAFELGRLLPNHRRLSGAGTG